MPNNPATIYLEGNSLILQFSGPGPLETSEIKVPDTIVGLNIVLSILRERARVSRPATTIGTSATPTQWEIEKWLKENKTQPLSTDPDEALKQLGF